MQVLHVSDLVNPATFFQDVSVICEQLLVDNSSSVVHFLEVRICEANEHLFHRLFGEIRMEGFHRVCSHSSHVQTLGISTVYSQSVRFFSDKVGYFIPDLLA